MFVSNSYGSNPATSFSGQKGKYGKCGPNKKFLNEAAAKALNFSNVSKKPASYVDSELGKIGQTLEKVAQEIKPLFRKK